MISGSIISESTVVRLTEAIMPNCFITESTPSIVNGELWSNVIYKSHGSKQTSTVTNSFYMYKVTDLLGLPDTVDVTSDMRTKARELINFMEPDSDHTDVKRFEVHDMPLKTNVSIDLTTDATVIGIVKRTTLCSRAT